MDKINRRAFLKKAGAVGTGAAVMQSLSACTLPAHKGDQDVSALPQKPNVLLIITDQERGDKTIPKQVQAELTNHLRLKRESVSFNNYYVATSPCSPSRASIYTGLHIQKHGVVENAGGWPVRTDLSTDIPTIGTMLRNHGYDTVYKGKWHISIKDWKTSTPDDLEAFGFSDWGDYGDKPGNGSRAGYDWDPVIADDAGNWLLKRSRESENDTPWFLAVNLNNPHDIMFHSTGKLQEATQRCNKTFKIGRPVDDPLYKKDWHLALPLSFYETHKEVMLEAYKKWQRTYEVIFGKIPFDDPSVWKEYQNHYYNCLKDVDRHLGTILDALEKSGMVDNTVVIYSSDHGELAGAHKLRAKEVGAFDEVMNVPLIIKVPGVRKDSTTDALASGVDLVPTILGLAGVDRSTQRKLYRALKGYDLTSVLQKPTSKGERDRKAGGLLMCFSTLHAADCDFTMQLLATPCGPGTPGFDPSIIKPYAKKMDGPKYAEKMFYRSVFNGRYKFTRHFSAKEHHLPQDMETLMAHNDVELFDLRTDPDELYNLARKPGQNRDLIMEMNAKLNQLVQDEAGSDDGSYMPRAPDTWKLAL